MGEQVIVGTLASNESGQYGPVLKIKTLDDRERTVYVGDKYEGTPPPVGSFGDWRVWESDPKPGRKYGSKYLNGFDAKTPVSTGATFHAGDGSRERSIIAQVAYKIAGNLLCAGVIAAGEGKAALATLDSIAADISEGIQTLAATTPKSEQPSEPAGTGW